MDFGYNNESLWLATTNSTIKNWSLKPPSSSSSLDQSSTSSSTTSPLNQKTKQSTTNIATNSDSSNILPINAPTAGAGATAAAAATTGIDKSSSSSLSSSYIMQMNPLNTQPLIRIKGTANIKQYAILNDKRTIVTKDSDDIVCVWDVLQARKLESLGKENFDHVIKQRQRFISIPNWFTVDLKLGLLTISLDENEWNSAWVNFKDMDSNHVRGTQSIDLSDAKVNYGCIFLESLFKNCLFINPLRVQTCSTVIYSSVSNSKTSSADDDQNQAGLLRFNIPDHIPIIFSLVSNNHLYSNYFNLSPNLNFKNTLKSN